jgi:hypothetical protein
MQKKAADMRKQKLLSNGGKELTKIKEERANVDFNQMAVPKAS